MSQNMIPGAEMRIVRLEENYWFQEERLKALDEQLLAQQKRMDSLEKSVKYLRDRVKELEDAADPAASNGGAREVELPPHYLQKPL